MTKLYVGNLPFSATEDSVRELFAAHGTVEKVALVNDRDTGQPRGFGFVEMSSADAQSAMQSLNGKDFGGRPLKVNEAQDKPRGGGGGGGYGRRRDFRTNHETDFSRPEGARNMLREKQRRNRMAAKELRAQYPQFTTIRVDLVFNEEVTQPPAPQSIVLHPPARAYFVYPCPYASCSGELDLAANVDHIAEQGKARAAGHAKCNGERHGPRGKGPCDLHIEYSIAVGK